jgi:hypothetical protein
VVNTDVRSVTIDHRNRTLKAKFGYTDLARTGIGFFVNWHVLTSEGKRFLAYASAGASRGGWNGQQTVLWSGSGKPLDCASLRSSFDYDANTVKVSLGTDCLGKPRWVRVGVKVASTGDDFLSYVDDAQRPDVVPTRSVILSCKIRRG